MKPNLQLARPTELLRDRVVNAIRQAILHGVFAPGQRLTERELIELTGVSRTSIREALRHLESAGLIENHPDRGLRVPILTPTQIEHIYDIRAALEPAAVRLFVERATADEVAALVDVCTRLAAPGSGVAGPNEPVDERQANYVNFDELLLKGARNPILEQMLGSLLTRIHALRPVSLTMPGRLAAAREEFARLVQAIAERDAEGASRLAYERVVHAKQAALWAVAHADFAEDAPEGSLRV